MAFRRSVVITISLPMKHLDFLDAVGKDKQMGRSKTTQYLFDLAATYMQLLEDQQDGV